MEKGGDEDCCPFCQRSSCVTRGDPNCLLRLKELAKQARQGGVMGDDLIPTADVVETSVAEAQSAGAAGTQSMVNEGFQYPVSALTDEQRDMLGGV